MKMKLFFAALLVSGLMFSTGCDKIKKAMDVEFSADYTINMNMTIPPASGHVKAVQSAFEGSATVDPTGDSQVKKYLKLIKSWKVTGLTGTFSKVTKEAVLETFTLTFSSDAGNASWTLTNVQIKNGESFVLDNTNHQWDELDKILSTKKPFKITVKGKTNIDDFSFTLSLALKTKVKANPLN